MLYLVDRANGGWNVSPIDETGDGFSEADMERWVLAGPGMLGEDLLVIKNQFTGFDRSGSTVDILALDRAGKLVIIELKKGDASRAELQAIEYAAMCSTMTLEHLAEVYAESSEEIATKDDAIAALRDFVSDRPEFEELDDDPRVIIVANGFRPELTATVLWLREKHGVDISCVRLRVHRLDDGRLAVTGEKIIPLPEAEEYRVHVVRKEQQRYEGPEHEFLQRVRQYFVAVLPEAPVNPPSRWSLSVWTGQGCTFYATVQRDGPQWASWIELKWETPDAVFNKTACREAERFARDIEEQTGHTPEFEVDWGPKAARLRFVLHSRALSDDFAKATAEALAGLYRAMAPHLPSIAEAARRASQQAGEDSDGAT